MDDREPLLLSSSTITNDPVRNPAGEDLGSVKDLMIDCDHGRIAYVIISFGGFMGMGDKLFAIPWEVLEINTEEHCLVLDVNDAVLENAPGFDKDDWPTEPDHEFLRRVYLHYEADPYFEQRGL